MTSEELQASSEAMAEDCLRYYPTLPLAEIKKIIAEHLRHAYTLGHGNRSQT